jgi:membrane-associated phospholipid phosphatase
VRRPLPLIAALLVGLGPSGQALADGDGPDPMSVYQVSAPIDGAIIALTTAGSLVPFAFTSRIIHPTCPCSPSSVNSFDRGVIGNASDSADLASNITLALVIALPPVADWIALRRFHVWLEDAVVFGEAMSVNGALVTMAKFTVQRPIPRVYSDPALASDPGNYRSFYSGHTSFAFAALSAASVTVNARYGLTWQPWLVTALVGASVAAERIWAGYHFYTDVLMGAGAGLVVGTAVTSLHLRGHGFHVAAFRPADGTGMGISLSGLL